jgi:hypothetical protein
VRRPVHVLFLALSGLVGACGHPQAEGEYQLTFDPPVLDSCGLAANPDLSASLTLTLAGDRAYADYSLYGLQLVGAYREGPLFYPSEQFYLDGSAANAAVTVNGLACQVDRVTAHVEASPKTTSSFTGSLGVKLETRQPEACVCEFQANFTAQRR